MPRHLTSFSSQLFSLSPTRMERELRCTVDYTFANAWEEMGKGRQRLRSAQKITSGSKIVLEFSFIIITVSLVALFADYLAIADIEEHASKLKVITCGSLSFLSFLSGIALICAINWFRDHWSAISLLLLSSCALLILTAASFLFFLHKRYYNISLLLVLVILLLATPFFCIIRLTAQGHTSALFFTFPSFGYKTNEAELKQTFAHSSLAVSVSLSGLVCTAVGASKSPAGQALSQQHTLEFFSIMLFFNITFGLVLMMLSSAPPKRVHQNARDPLSRVLKGFSYVPLVLLALLASVSVSSLLIGSYHFLPIIFFLPFLGVTVWLVACNCCTNNQQQEKEIRGVKSDLKLQGKFADTTASITFGCLTAILSGYPAAWSSKGGGVVFLKIFVVAAYMAFVFSFNVKLLKSEAPKKRILVAVVKTLYICPVISLALAVAELYFLLVL